MSKDQKDVAVIVQARMSSQRCPNKMTRDFAGTTLMDICLKKLCESKIPNKNIIACVHEKELIDLCSQYPISIFLRSEKSARSEGTPMTEMYEWWDKIKFKYVILVNACTPFLTKETIQHFFSDYCHAKNDGMFGVIEKNNYFWDEQDNFLTPLTEAVMNTKTAKVVKEAAHCLYASRLDSIGKGIWMGDFNKPKDIKLFSIREDQALDIDHEWQFRAYAKLYESMK